MNHLSFVLQTRHKYSRYNTFNKVRRFIKPLKKKFFKVKREKNVKRYLFINKDK